MADKRKNCTKRYSINYYNNNRIILNDIEKLKICKSDKKEGILKPFSILFYSTSNE